MIIGDRTPRLSHLHLAKRHLALRDLSDTARSAFCTPVKTPSGKIIFMKPEPLNPAAMALRCEFPPAFGVNLTEGKIYLACLSVSELAGQFVRMRDDLGNWVNVSASRFDPCNPKRRPLFRHLNAPAKKGRAA